jgi:hypothetical protein
VPHPATSRQHLTSLPSSPRSGWSSGGLSYLGGRMPYTPSTARRAHALHTHMMQAHMWPPHEIPHTATVASISYPTNNQGYPQEVHGLPRMSVARGMAATW